MFQLNQIKNGSVIKDICVMFLLEALERAEQSRSDRKTCLECGGGGGGSKVLQLLQQLLLSLLLLLSLSCCVIRRARKLLLWLGFAVGSVGREGAVCSGRISTQSVVPLLPRGEDVYKGGSRHAVHGPFITEHRA